MTSPVHWLLYGLVFLLPACSTTHQNVRRDVQVQRAATEVAENHLLDVWIALFSPGELPEDKDDSKGLSPEIRKAEARYMPVQLRETMEKTGYWGAVRVVPQNTEGAEVLVQGKILASDGEKLELQITAVDATGQQWFERTYEEEAALADYRQAEGTGREVFQPLYNAIANDLAEYRNGLSAERIVTIRRVASLRFADDLAPDAFKGYLQENASGEYAVARLPAREDPMVRRINAIRERDFMLVDTLNGHFDNFHGDMQEPYFQWRKSRLAELEAMRAIQRDARNRKLLGAAAIIGAIAIEALGGDSTRASTSSLRNVMLVGGAYAVKTGFDKASEATIHRDAIEELGESFASESQPMVVDVEGETHKLTGSAEAQYAEWRTLLRKIYASETGLDADDNNDAAQ
ncbi:MAG: hypothetical protein LJE58_15165 [Thiogranum sp.]|jgi:hypothetical protein|nr:hypothetical protein [Thiogranum sp.]